MDSLCPPVSSNGGSTAPNGINPVVQGVANQVQNAISDAVANWLRGGDPYVKAAAAAAAAEAERQRQAEFARQQAIAAQKRQQMFDRLSHELMGFSNGPQLQLMGMSDSTDLKLIGMDKPQDLPLMGFGDATSGQGTPTPTGPQTCFFGECGPSDAGPLEPWGDPKVVDLRDLQQGVDLASVATKAPPADRQTIMDQALAAANGDQAIQVTVPPDSAVPVMSEQGLLAFQQANNSYRQAHESAYQLQQAYNLMETKRQGVYAVIKLYQDQLENDLRSHMDEMSLAQQEAALAQIFDAAIQLHAAYGHTWSQYLAARQQYYQYQYQMQMYLWNTALGKPGNPPSPPRQLAQATADLPVPPPDSHSGPPDSDLNLVLPPLPPVASPTNEDRTFLEQIDLKDAGVSSDAVTQRVLDGLHQDIAANWSAQPALACPPNIQNQYRTNPQLQQQMNTEGKTIFTAQQQATHAAMQDAENEWNQKLAQLQSQGAVQPGIPLTQQAQTNPQLRTQLDAIQKQVTSGLDYKVTRAQFEAEKQWQQWIEAQEATLPKPALTSVAAARD